MGTAHAAWTVIATEYGRKTGTTNSTLQLGSWFHAPVTEQEHDQNGVIRKQIACYVEGVSNLM